MLIHRVKSYAAAAGKHLRTSCDTVGSTVTRKKKVKKLFLPFKIGYILFEKMLNLDLLSPLWPYPHETIKQLETYKIKPRKVSADFAQHGNLKLRSDDVRM